MAASRRIHRRLGKNRGGIKGWAKAFWSRVARRRLNGSSRTVQSIGERC